MGMATYYMKISFEDDETAGVMLPKIREFIKEGSRAENFWQAHRGMNKTDRKGFWAQFKKEFPQIYDYLGKLRDGDCDNELAGHVDFGREDEVDDNLNMEGNIIRYSAYVWHFAEWNPFERYLKSKFNASDTAWISDEYMDAWEYLECVGG